MADETPKIPANDNPWYVLATFYGEQEGEVPWDFDEDIHEDNRQFWNCWMAADLPDEEQQRLIDKGWVTRTGLDEVREKGRDKLWAGERCRDLPTPDPDDGINFNNTVFGGQLVLNRMLFPGPADFRAAGFQGIAFFQDAEFQGIAFFQDAEFQGIAFFQDAEFQGYAVFQDAEFQGYAVFRDAEFQGYAVFTGTSKREDRLNARRFAGVVSFVGAEFRGHSDFTNREFLDTTSFNNARFHTRAPIFADTTLHEGTTWHGVQWPQTPSDRKMARDMADAYSHLRRRSNAIQDHEAELNFFGRELRAKRAWKGGATGLLITLYEWSCGFGQSVHLPVFWLLGLWAGFPPVYHLVMQHAGMTGIDPVKLYFFSAASLGGFLGVRKEFFTAEFMEKLPWIVQSLSVTQSVLGAVFVFLLGLSLRNRFRIK